MHKILFMFMCSIAVAAFGQDVTTLSRKDLLYYREILLKQLDRLKNKASLLETQLHHLPRYSADMTLGVMAGKSLVLIQNQQEDCMMQLVDIDRLLMPSPSQRKRSIVDNESRKRLKVNHASTAEMFDTIDSMQE